MSKSVSVALGSKSARSLAGRLFSKRSLPKWRLFSLLIIHLLFGIHLLHWSLKGKSLAPFEFSESLYTIHEGILTLGCFFAIAAALGTLVFGRFFCGWGCHILALQDLCAWLLARAGIRPKPIRSRFMVWVPAGILFYAYAWPQVERILAHRPHPPLRVQQDADGWASFVTTDLFRAMPGPAFAVATLLVCGFFTVYFLGSRSFCYSVCPYGVIFGVVQRFAPGARLVLKGGCENCGLCTLNCKSGVQVIQELKQHGTVVDTNCLKSLDCLSGCPSDAIGLAFRSPLRKEKGAPRLPGPARKYDFTLREEFLLAMLFPLLFAIYYGLHEIGLFLAGSIAAIGAALGVKFIRSVSKSGLGNLPIFVRLAAPALVCLTAYCAFIHYHVFMGQRLSRGNVDPEGCARHLRIAYDYGLVGDDGAERELARTYATLGEFGSAQAFFLRYLGKHGHDVALRVRYGQMLSAQGLEREAYNQYLAAMVPDTLLERKVDKASRGMAHSLAARHLAMSGDTGQALAHLEQAIADVPKEATHYCNYAYLCIRKGEYGRAREILARAPVRPEASGCIAKLSAMAEQARW